MILDERQIIEDALIHPVSHHSSDSWQIGSDYGITQSLALVMVLWMLAARLEGLGSRDR